MLSAAIGERFVKIVCRGRQKASLRYQCRFWGPWQITGGISAEPPVMLEEGILWPQSTIPLFWVRAVKLEQVAM